MTEQTTPQIDSVTPDTALVTITIGGNDANILLDAVRLSCAHDPGPVQNAPNLPPPLRDLLCGPVDRDADRALAEALEPRLVELIEAVQARAPHARIIITDYVELLPRNGAGCAVVPLTRDEAKFIIAQQLRTNLAIEHAAQRTGATLLDISRDSRGHDACSAQPWVNGYQFGDFTVVGLDVYHARLVAHEAIAARAGDLLANAADSDEAR